MLVALLVWLA
jgi:hypothetical protein